MGQPIKRKKDMRFPTMKSLYSVTELIDEAQLALNEPGRTQANSQLISGMIISSSAGIPTTFASLAAGAIAVTAAATTGLAAASALSFGVAATAAAVAAPVVAIGAAGAITVNHIQLQKLLETKKSYLRRLTLLQAQMETQLQKDAHTDLERTKYLRAICRLLQLASSDLAYDLGE